MYYMIEYFTLYFLIQFKCLCFKSHLHNPYSGDPSCCNLYTHHSCCNHTLLLRASAVPRIPASLLVPRIPASNTAWPAHDPDMAWLVARSPA